jgi:hypothetical protein
MMRLKSRCNNNKTIVLECVVDCYMWIWYINFGNAGSLNDIKILDKSSIVTSICTGNFDLKCPSYQINKLVCDFMYFLVDGIYPPWSIFMNTIRVPTMESEKRYSSSKKGVGRMSKECSRFCKINSKFLKMLYKYIPLNILIASCSVV